MVSAYDQAANEELHQYTQHIFANLGYELLDAASEQDSDCPLTDREQDGEVVLKKRLVASLFALNPHIALDARTQAINDAVEVLSANRTLLDPIEANREIYKLLKDGVSVQLKSGSNISQEEQRITVKIINWDEPEKNDFLLVSNFWVSGREGRGRLDFVGFINGLPLLLPVTRVAGGRENPLKRLYETDLADDKRRFPQLFWYNALILLSDGQQSKLGSVTATWEYFADWKRSESEEEAGDTTLETLIIGTCEKKRVLDISENFTLFYEGEGTLIKIIGRNHQYLGVNAAFARMQRYKELHGKLGVFWHTQGAGKSYSMIFFEQKVQRKLPGNWRFVVITDRIDLDKQIYDNFRRVNAVTEGEESARVSRIKDLRTRLRENHSILFILIQKFQPERPSTGEGDASNVVADEELEEPNVGVLSMLPGVSSAPIEAISDSDEIIVMTDEAHRSEGADLAGYMRNALPNASYLGFTGTPLIGEEIHRTRDIFGPYISKYPFLQAIEDHVTVPLIYDNHTPRVYLNVSEVAQKIQEEEQKRALNDKEKQRFVKDTFQIRELYKGSAYLDFVARDIVEHFMERGYLGKAMVVCLDKLTTVRLYNRVQQEWQRYQERLQQQLSEVEEQEERAKLLARLEYASTTDMAVVVSAAEPKEDDTFARFNKDNPQERVEIQPYYDRLQREKLDEKFKKVEDTFRMAFVCAMWITGFDVPCLSTLYLVNPMTMHTLMQALARPNRLYGAEKKYGQIVDYVGIYEELMEALKIYARPEQGFSGVTAEMPFSEKGELIQELAQSLSELERFCQQQGVNIQQEFAAVANARSKRERDAHIQRIANTLVIHEDTKLNYLSRTWYVYHLYQALLPDKEVSLFAAHIHILRQVQQVIFAAMNCVNINDVLTRTRRIIAEDVTIYEKEPQWSRDDPDTVLSGFDLSKVSFDDLALKMRTGNTYLQAEQLRSFLQQKLQQMIQVNPQRVSYVDRLQNIVTKHNAKSADFADYPAEMVEFAQEIHAEELRSSREQLSEEELAIADLLLLHIPYAEADWAQIKEIVRALLARLKNSNNLVDNWYNKADMNGKVRTIIKEELDKLPDVYSPSQYRQKCEETYRYVRAYYRSGGNGPISA